METNPQLADTSIQTNQKHHHHHHHHHHHNPHNQYPQHNQYLRQQHNRKQLQRNPSLTSDNRTTSLPSPATSTANTSLVGIATRSQKQQTKDYLGGGGGVVGASGGFGGEPGGSLASGVNVQTQSSSNSMAYQHKHALHRLRRLKKRAPHRDLVISFVPRLRTSIINRLDFFNRYSKQEQEVLSCFDFLDELVLTYCDGGSESPRYSQKLYQSLINELIDSA